MPLSIYERRPFACIVFVGAFATAMVVKSAFGAFSGEENAEFASDPPVHLQLPSRPLQPDDFRPQREIFSPLVQRHCQARKICAQKGEFRGYDCVQYGRAGRDVWYEIAAARHRFSDRGQQQDAKNEKEKQEI
ncbi:hypothetical protein MTO96_020731 [Rhipicephalus appendiculatus]